MAEAFFGDNDSITSNRGRQLSPPTASDLRLESLSDSCWRVCDKRLPADDTRSILGFIEETRGQFEVMELGGEYNFAWFTFASIREAISHFDSARQSTTGTETSVRL
jgi:hypothetical protein